MKNEIICITRCGFNHLHTERVDQAAMVTAYRWQTDEPFYYPEEITYQVLFVPRLVNGIAPDWNTL